jgi:hypothetical protein
MAGNKLILRAKLAKNYPLAERRAFVRYACTQNGSCRPIRSGEMNRWSAMIADISSGGLSLVMCRPFEQGEILALELRNVPKGCRRKLFVRVMRAQAESEHVWLVGCRFVHRLTDEELEALV